MWSSPLSLRGSKTVSPGWGCQHAAGLPSCQRSVICGSQPNRFRQEFRPAGNDSPAPGPLIIPLSEAVAHDDDEVPDPQYWTQSPHGAFRVPNPHAQYTRLAPIDTMPIGPAGNEAYYYFEMQSFYSKRWPGMRRSAEGRWEFQPGFLGPFLGTSQPENMYAASVHHFIFSTWDRLLHAAIAVAYIATAAGAFQMLWAQNYNLAAVLLLGWARQRLELPKLAALLGLAWVNKLWLYWVLLGAKVLDKVLKRIAPPVRGTAWVFFWLWAAYVVFSPLYMHPFPFFGIAPGIDATDHIGPQLYEKPDIPNIY